MANIVGLSEEGKQDIALALILLKDFKSDGRFDAGAIVEVLRLAEFLGVKEQYNKLISKIPPMDIKPK